MYIINIHAYHTWNNKSKTFVNNYETREKLWDSVQKEVEKLNPSTIGRIRGAKSNSYTKGTICAKVARYAERTHHPGRRSGSRVDD